MANELILIVEDNEKNLKLTRDVLRFHGFRTIEATDGETGVRLAGEQRPQLILMDIQMPGIDGIEALRRIRADDATARITTVALTASVMSGDRERFDAAGFDGFIAKPIDIKTFPDQVRSHLETKR
ncbi:MAG TPA: response regulator [Candidatus Saccharimonadales bacterium]|nr:response regulator [Candidatus Saccharimonadales bacterium]